MSKPDKNFLSLAGDGLGNIYRDGVLLFSADQPGMREIRLGDIIPDRPGDYSDSLKLSGCTRLRVLVNTIVGGREDCLDINWSHDIEVEIATAMPKGRYVATIKGGSTDISVKVENQIGHGSETDYDLGNWSDQGHSRTTGVSLDVHVVGGSPAYCRVLHAHNPKVVGFWKIDGRFRGFFHWVVDKLKRLNWA
jgi:hypothetical protein